MGSGSSGGCPPCGVGSGSSCFGCAPTGWGDCIDWDDYCGPDEDECEEILCDDICFSEEECEEWGECCDGGFGEGGGGTGWMDEWDD